MTLLNFDKNGVLNRNSPNLTAINWLYLDINNYSFEYIILEGKLYFTLKGVVIALRKMGHVRAERRRLKLLIHNEFKLNLYTSFCGTKKPVLLLSVEGCLQLIHSNKLSVIKNELEPIMFQLTLIKYQNLKVYHK